MAIGGLGERGHCFGVVVHVLVSDHRDVPFERSAAQTSRALAAPSLSVQCVTEAGAVEVRMFSP